MSNHVSFEQEFKKDNNVMYLIGKDKDTHVVFRFGVPLLIIESVQKDCYNLIGNEQARDYVIQNLNTLTESMVKEVWFEDSCISDCFLDMKVVCYEKE